MDKKRTEYEKEEVASVPFFYHENECWRLERIIKRLAWICAAGWACVLGVLAYVITKG